jgi:hypothetical protein
MTNQLTLEPPKKKDRREMTSDDMDTFLRAHFAPPHFAYLSQVRNGTGFRRKQTRTAAAMAGLISYGFGEFGVCIIGGDTQILTDGWYYHPGPGGTYCYGTRGFAALQKALDRGFKMSAEAIAAKATHADEPEFAFQKERERLELCRQEQTDREAHETARLVLVGSARAKLTPEEFDAIEEGGREY